MMRGALSKLGPSESKNFPFIRRLVASYTVGDKVKNGKLCQWLFPCNDEKVKLQQLVQVQV